MKKINAIAALFFAFLLFSCSKKNTEGIATQNESKPQDVKVPHFDESNSIAIPWDQLPAELRNAKPIEKQEDSTAEGVSSLLPSSGGSISSYSPSYSIGPWGGSGGSPFSIYSPPGSRIYAIGIRSGSYYIEGLTVWYMSAFGKLSKVSSVGGTGGSYYIQYLNSSEHISSITGRSGSKVYRLGFHTNFKTFAYGSSIFGSAFSASVADFFGYQILGFWGRAGSNLDQIGCFVY